MVACLLVLYQYEFITQVLVSKYQSPTKELGLLGEMVNSRAGAGKYKMSLGYLVVTESGGELRERDGGREGKKNNGNMSKGHKNQSE